MKSRTEASALQWAQLAERFPEDAARFLDRVRRNRVSLNVESDAADRLTDSVDRSSRNISLALIMSALIVGSSIMVLANRTETMDMRSILGLLGYLFAGSLGVLRLIQYIRTGR